MSHEANTKKESNKKATAETIIKSSSDAPNAILRLGSTAEKGLCILTWLDCYVSLAWNLVSLNNPLDCFVFDT
jgi:hypothetical protein